MPVNTINNHALKQEKVYLQRCNRFLHHTNKSKFYWSFNVDVAGRNSFGIAILHVHPNGTPYPISDPRNKIFDVTFDSGYDSKGSKTNNMHRRGYVHASRLINRKKNRKIELNKLMVKHHFLLRSYLNKHYRFNNHSKLAHKLSLINSSNKKGFYYIATMGLDHKLSHLEIYSIVNYAMNHRGYKPMTNNQDGKMLKAIAETHKNFVKSGYRTVLEMLYKDPKYQSKKHNSNQYNGYLCMVTRNMIADAIKQVLKNQQNYYNNLTNKLIMQILVLITRQRTFDVGTGSNSPHAGTLASKRGLDTITPVVNGENNYVLPKSTATFELVRAWGAFNDLTYTKDEIKHHLTHQQKVNLIKLRYKKQSITYKNISHELGFTPDSYSSQKKPSQNTFISFKITKKLSSCLPKSLKYNDNLIDKIGTTLALNKSPKLRLKALKKIHLSAKVLKNIQKVATQVSFGGESRFSKSTMKKFLPYLEEGYNQQNAEYKAGVIHKHVKKSVLSLSELHLLNRQYTNPSFWRINAVMFKIMRFFVNKLGRPLTCHLERGTEPTNNSIIRKQITNRQYYYAQRNKRINRWLQANNHRVNKKNRLKYILYKRQNGRDMISHKLIKIKYLFDTDNYYQIDHIQPLAITGDNRFSNKELISTKENEEKGNQTILQYLGNHKKAIQKFISNVNKIYPSKMIAKDKKGNIIYKKIKKTIKVKGKKKKITKKVKTYKSINVGIRLHLFRKVPRDAHKIFMARDLVTVRDYSSFLYNFLRKHMYYYGNNVNHKQRTFMNSGFATHILGRTWNLPQYQNDIGKHSVSDKNHAIDALMIGYLSPSYVKRISKAYKQGATKINIPYPYPNFVNDLNNVSHRIYSRRIYKANNHVGIAKDTRYSAKYMKHHLKMIRVPIKKLRLKDNGHVIYNGKGVYDTKNQHDKEFLRALKKYIQLPNTKSNPKPNYLMYKGNQVNRLKVYSKIYENSMILSKDHASLYQNNKAMNMNVYKTPNNYYCGSIQYAKNRELHQPSKLIADGKYRNHINNKYKYLFSLHPWTPVLCILKPKNIKTQKGTIQSKEVDCGKNKQLARKIKGKKGKKKKVVPIIKTIHGRTNNYIINNKTFKGIPYVQYVPTRILVSPQVQKITQKKTSIWIGRRIMSDVFIGYVRRFSADGSIFLQPFDCTADANMCQKVKISQVKSIKKLKSENFTFNKFRL